FVQRARRSEETLGATDEKARELRGLRPRAAPSDERRAGRGLVLRIQLEEDAEGDLVFEPPLLQPAAHLLDDEPRKLAQGLTRAPDGHLDGVAEALVGSADDLDPLENGPAHKDALR